MKRTKDLKPCPWCGGDVFLVREGINTVCQPMLHYQIRCPNDGAMMVTSWPVDEDEQQQVADLIESWNNTVWDEEKEIWVEKDV